MLINISKINLNPNVGGGKPIELENKEITITENGTTTVTPSTGFGGMSSVDITTDVPTPKVEANKSISIIENGSYSVTPSDGYVGVGDVDISVFVSEIGTSIDFSEIGYNATDNANANMSIQDGINYAKKIQAEYTDSMSYSNDGTLVYFPNVDTSNRTSCSNMFNGCGGLQYVPPLTITNKCTTMYQMFQKCGALNYLDVSNFDTSNVTTMVGIFNNCRAITELDLSNWDTSNVTQISGGFTETYPFYYMTNLKSINLTGWDVSKIQNFGNMFSYCQSLEEIIGIENWDLSSATSLSAFFNNCSSLKSLNLSGWDLTNYSNNQTSNYNTILFGYSTLNWLTDLQSPKNINTNMSFNTCINLTVDSLLSILNNLTDRTSTTSMKCILGTNNLNKLTDEQKAIATSKNWVLS